MMYNSGLHQLYADFKSNSTFCPLANWHFLQLTVCLFLAFHLLLIESFFNFFSDVP